MARFSTLTIGINADSARLERALGRSGRELRNFEQGAGDRLRRVATAAVRTATALIGIGTALGVLGNARAEFNRNLLAISTAAGLSTDEFRSQAFAAQQAGIEVDQLGSIYQDTLERIGDFLATGGGPFQDFIDVMGLTAAQGRELAMELEGLAGPQVLEELVSRMEQAGVSTEQMSFALEGLASDATRLIPILTNNAAEARRLQESFEGIAIPLTPDDQMTLSGISEAFSRLGVATGDFSDQLVTALGPAIISVTDFIANLIRDLSDAINSIEEDFSMFGTFVESLFQEVAVAIALPFIVAFRGMQGIVVEIIQFFFDQFDSVLGLAERASDLVGFDNFAAQIRAARQSVSDLGADVTSTIALRGGFQGQTDADAQAIRDALTFNTEAVMSNTEATMDVATGMIEAMGGTGAAGDNNRRGGTAADPAQMATQSLLDNLSNALATGDFSSLGDIFVNSLSTALTGAISMQLNDLLSDSLGNIFSSIFGGLFAGSFQRGGVVPGRGPVPIIAHGGEVVLNRQQQMALLRGGTGGSTVQNFNITGDVTAATRPRSQG